MNNDLLNMYVTPAQLADLLHIKKATVYAILKKGYIKSYRPVARRILIKMADVEQHLSANETITEASIMMQVNKKNT